MTIPSVTATPVDPAREAKLHKATRQLEGVFVDQMMKAMRQTVSHDGIMGENAGEEMFTSMLDEHIADKLPGQWQHGLASAAYRELSR